MPHVLVNALSVGSSGNLTVVREITRHLRLARQDWPITLLVSEGRRALHDQLIADLAMSNVAAEWAPTVTRSPFRRVGWERREIPKLVARRGVDVVYTPTGTVAGPAGVPTFAHFGDPWPYLPVRDLWYDPALAWLRRRGHRRGLRFANAAGFTSAFLRDTLARHFGRLPEPNAILYNGVPDAWADRDPRTLTPLADRPAEILTVSQVSKYKRQELVIRALPSVIELTGRRDWRYRIVGAVTDEMRSHLARVADSIGVGENISIEGRVSDGAVADALGRARAFVSMSVCESFGIPTIEAMSFGTPVVAARATAVPEVCGDAAALVTPDDVEALAAALARVLTDPAHAEAMRARGLANVKRFRWSATAEALATMLERLAIRR